MEIPIVGLRPPGNDVGCWELGGKRKFPIYYIGNAENDIFLTFSQKKLSFAF